MLTKRNSREIGLLDLASKAWVCQLKRTLCELERRLRATWLPRVTSAPHTHQRECIRTCANNPAPYRTSSQIGNANLTDAELKTLHSKPKMLGMQTTYWLSRLLKIKSLRFKDSPSFWGGGVRPYSTPIHISCCDPFGGSSCVYIYIYVYMYR